MGATESMTEPRNEIDLPNAQPTPAELFGALYGELHRQASMYMRTQRVAHTLQPTALVHEAYLRLRSVDPTRWTSEEHFRAFASKTMFRILVDHARAKGRKKRKAPGERVPLDAVLVHFASQSIDILDLEDGLERLHAEGGTSSRAASVLEMRTFAGLGMDQISVLLGTPKRTIERDYQWAKAWLREWLGDASET